jgi:hypothetical protein
MSQFNWSESCWCAKCDEAERAKSSNPFSYMRMNLCPDCGNKRCPKATDHRNACGDSNEPGQEGSRY